MKRILEALAWVVTVLFIIAGVIGLVIALVIVLWPKDSLPGEIAIVGGLALALGLVALALLADW